MQVGTEGLNRTGEFATGPVSSALREEGGMEGVDAAVVR